ncbi:MAG TPA: hypothetical protein PLD20_16055 [Blastocatellia bacterium]|nr:hypothetical protein [Blastocatellia bacterium]HMV83951.1 hypothetical protein [Blastocatellia bacterium]HMX24277.1 hypothetical protein [Blastocatellia bacterium]HMY71040.1 hypothetical protein [Blastocatellia bacterium]HMZ19452.1 hypothetical protein [Blastocatellia bacterium]
MNDTDTVMASLHDLSTYWENDVDTFLTLKQFAKSDNIQWGDEARETCLEQLFEYWKDHPDTFFLLKDCAVNDPSPSSDKDLGNVRGTAMQLLARSWPDDPDTLELLRERAENDPMPWLREEAKRLADQVEARNSGGQ